MSFFSFDIGLGEASISEIYEIPEDEPAFRDRTQDYLDVITKPVPKKWFSGGVQPTVITVEGKPGRGKSQIVKSSMDIIRSNKQWKSPDGLIRGYKIEDVQTIYCKAKNGIPCSFHMEEILGRVKDVPVCVIVIDDALNFKKKELEALISFYSDIRHRWAKKICDLRGIILKEKEEPLDHIDVGLPVLFVLFQDKFDMDTGVRRKADIEIRMNEPIHQHHAQMARQAVGDEAVTASHINQALITKGHYTKIGHGTIVMALEDAKGLAAGKIYFPIKKTRRKLTDYYDEIIDIEYEYLKGGVSVSTKSPEKGKDFRVTDSKTWTGLEDYLSEKFWDHKSKEKNVWLRDLFNETKGIYREDGEFVWKQSHPVKNPFMIKEKVRMFVYRNYQGFEDWEIAKKCNEIRYKNKVSKTLDTRSIENYRSKSFFQKVSLASNGLGVWLEGFVVLKMKYLVSELLKENHSTKQPLTEEQREILKRTVITGGFGSPARSDFSFGEAFFMNVKNQLVRRGDFQPTPEARLAQENNSSFGVLNIKALKPGIAQLYLYTQSMKDCVGGSVPSKIPFSKFKSISGWLDLLLEILAVIAL